MFTIGSAWSLVVVVVAPGILGSHAAVYAEAARAWLTGGDPWQVGPALVVFAGPPTMLLPFVPFAFLPGDVTRFGWVILDAAIAVWAVRRLELPAYWLAFPPLFEAIVLGHPEVLVLGLLVLGREAKARFAGPMAGLAALIKPYAVLPLLAERRIAALAVAAAATVATLVFLPWAGFFRELPAITANLARQNVGDSTYGQPVLMVIAVLALAAIGPRRALWLGVPLLWPYAQPIYKVMSIPVLPPLLALAWAIPVPGMSLIGIVALALLVSLERRRPLPGWVALGIRPTSRAFEPARSRSSSVPIGVAAGAPARVG